jgi:hypothetical protein
MFQRRVAGVGNAIMAWQEIELITTPERKSHAKLREENIDKETSSPKKGIGVRIFRNGRAEVQVELRHAHKQEDHHHTT